MFYRIKNGFGPFNLRVVWIVLMANLVSLFALHDANSHTEAMGVLGIYLA